MPFAGRALLPYDESGEPDVVTRRDPHPPVRRGAGSGTPHVGVLVERRYLAQLQPAGLVAALGARGCRVRLIDPQAEAFRLGEDAWLSGLDVVVARGRSWELLCLLARAEARGVPTINRRSAIGAVHNKAEMALALETAGVPMPKTFLGSPRGLGARLATGARGARLVLKPVFGDNGDGLKLVNEEAELEGIDWPEPVALAQEVVPGGGRERKLYGIGEKVWAVERQSLFALDRGEVPVQSAAPRAQAVPPTPAELGLAAYCRRLFGLEFYGLDCIPAAGGPVVIEVNDFPNYTGVPEASDRLAEFVVSRVQQAAEEHA